MRVLPRKVEAAVGGRMLKFAEKKFLKDSQLVKKEIQIPSPYEPGGPTITITYYERDEVPDNTEATAKDNDRKTLLLCHGITEEAQNRAPMVGVIKKVHPHWRIIIPNMIGHGHDLERVRKEGSSFQYPTPLQLLQSLEDFCIALQIEQCFGFGISMGGALLYFLQQRRPTLIPRCVLISPALEAVIQEEFVNDFLEGRKNHFCVTSRQDVKVLFRDLSCPQRKRNDPVPKFLLEAIWRDHKNRAPPGHFRKFFQKLLEERGNHPEYFGCTTDLAPQLFRLVIWPQNDYIANHDKGKKFFESSPNTTFHSVPDCGHLFHSNGRIIIDFVIPLMMAYFEQEEN